MPLVSWFFHLHGDGEKVAAKGVQLMLVMCGS